jgi:hypothetical protein
MLNTGLSGKLTKTYYVTQEDKYFHMKTIEDKVDFWKVPQTIKDIYLSEGVIATLLDYERVLDEMDLYAFKNWSLGELVEGPEISRYAVTCVWMWPAELMPDPRGAKRLLPFGCKIKWKKTTMRVPIKIEDPDDFRIGTKKPKLLQKPIWLIEIEMPKYLINDIRQGSFELEDQDIDIADLDSAYEQDIDLDQYTEDQI